MTASERTRTRERIGKDMRRDGNWVIYLDS
jgi:hypothetical protein